MDAGASMGAKRSSPLHQQSSKRIRDRIGPRAKDSQSPVRFYLSGWSRRAISLAFPAGEEIPESEPVEKAADDSGRLILGGGWNARWPLVFVVFVAVARRPAIFLSAQAGI